METNKKYYIVDFTSNTGKHYINAITHKNSGDKDGCLCFNSYKEAFQFILNHNWDNWATVE